MLALKMRSVQRWRRAVRRLKSRLQPKALVLMYHRIADLPLDPQLLCVTPRHFDEHLQVIQEYCHPLSLADLVEALHKQKLPDRTVVLTFDDGYVDNLYHAKPALERYNIPATVFVTTGYVGQPHEFWWDELERLLLQPGTLPTRLQLSINGTQYRWNGEPGRHYTEEEYQLYCSWHVERTDTPTPHHQLYRELHQLFHSLYGTVRQQLLAELLAWTGREGAGRRSHRSLTPEEIVILGRDGLIEVGAHTVTHPALASLTPAAQQAEIEQSKVHLETLLGHPVTSFAYPHGSNTAETVALVRGAGFDCACSSHADAVWRNADRFQLARVGVRDWDGDLFSRWLKEWLGD